MLLFFYEQPKDKNILRNRLKCFGKKTCFFPNQKETFLHFHINILNSLALKPTEGRLIEDHMKLQQPAMLKFLLGSAILALPPA